MKVSVILSTVFHYQVKVHFFSSEKLAYTEQPMKISLYGTHDEKIDIPYTMYVWFDIK